MKKNIVIIILSVVILGLGGYLVYDKAIDKKAENSNEKVNIENKEESDIQVIDFVNFTFDRSKDPIVCWNHTIDGVDLIRIPVLDSNKKGAKELNKVIKKDLDKWIERSKLDEEVFKEQYTVLTSNYVYYKDDKYISLKILASEIFPCRGGGGTYYTYTYDITNDKQLSNADLLKLYNISEDYIIERFSSSTYGQYSKEELEGYVKDKYKLYMDESGYLVSIVEFGPAVGSLEEKFVQIEKPN